MSERKFIEDAAQLEKLAPVINADIKRHVFVCNGKSCSAVGSADVKKTFEDELQERNLRYGKEFCSIGTAVLVYPEGVWYGQVRAEDVPEIIEEHLVNGRIVKRLALIEMNERE
jgi:(2Fe-2S) ferredoxin